uniref:Uncharacterized protein n=1 Tax=Aegilops tauschii subsp. strangulata TaxID=200361 RepID=A0A453BDW8_AEGTS
VMSMDSGDSMTDVFEGVQFTWTSVSGDGRKGPDSLELTFDAEHTDMALGRYVPSITAAVEQTRRRDCALKIFMNEGLSWRGISHNHPATFDTLAMDPPTKQTHTLVSSSDECLNILSLNANMEWQSITLSGLLNFIDGLWSASGKERVIIFTTNYKDRLDPALLRPGRMDMHIYMGYCGWEAFRMLARNYFLVDDHPLFPEIQELLAEVEVTPAEVSEMLLRNEDADIALLGLVEFLTPKKQGKKDSVKA